MGLLPGQEHQSFRARCKNCGLDRAYESDAAKRDRYEKEQEEIKSEAEHKQAEAKSNFHQHEVFARSVTMFQIAIAIAAISALTKKPSFWMFSLLFGIAGCVFLALGFGH